MLDSIMQVNPVIVTHTIYKTRCEVVKELFRGNVLVLRDDNTGKTFHIDRKVLGHIWMVEKDGN